MGSPGGSGRVPGWRLRGDGVPGGQRTGSLGTRGWRLRGDGVPGGQRMEAYGGQRPGAADGVPGDPGTEAQGVTDCGCREEWGLQCTQRRATDLGALPAGKSSPLSPSLQGLGRI